jgi:hypothetical protein
MIEFLMFYWLFSSFVLLGIYLADDKDVKLISIVFCLLLAGLLFPICLGGLITRICDKMNE